MPNLFQFLPMVINQNVFPQVLERTPEPESQVVTNGESSVTEYDQVMDTKLAISYAVATEAIYRTRTAPISRAIDVACGPGHLSLNMTRDLAIERMTGIDLSEGMVATATKNARTKGIPAADFQVSDATALPFDDAEFELATMMDAAHHLPSLQLVQRALQELDRVTKPEGHVVVMDLVRLRSAELTKRYVEVLGHDYVQRGLPDFYQQFHDSMFAAWTPDELASAVPVETRRRWVLLVPRGLPFAQFLFGLPEGQSDVFTRRGVPWDHPPLRDEELGEYRMASLGLSYASRRWLGT